MLTTNRYLSKLYDSANELTDNQIQKMKQKVKQDQKYYPQIHIAPQYGLLNDPNGLAYYNGYYYIFYQYHPNQVAHGLKHWALVRTKDFRNYEDFGLFLKPHNKDDNFGVFSGGAIVMGENLYLFYTGNHRDKQNNYERKPNQYLVIMNKEHQIIKRTKIIDYDLNFTEHNRDPFPFKYQNNYYLIIGAQKSNQKGVITLYTFDENYQKLITKQQLKIPIKLQTAYMLECPTYVNIKGQHLLIVSPQGMEPSKDKYLNIYNVVYMISSDFTNYTNAFYDQVDYGFDFYAPQIFDDGKRKILIAWLGQAETIYPFEKEFEYSQMLSLAREISIKNNKLYQHPLAEYKKLRINKKIIKQYNQLKTRTFECEFKVTRPFQLTLGNNEYYLTLNWDGQSLELNRQKMEFLVNVEYGTTRKIQITNCQKIKMIVDNSAIEIFINNGEYVMSARFFISKIEMLNLSCQILGNIYELQKINRIDK